MPNSETTAMLLDELAALDPPQRREVAKELRKVAENLRRGARRSGNRSSTPVAGPLARLRLTGVDPVAGRARQ
jgi:hypothetical protein